MMSSVSPRWNHSMSSGLPPAMLSKALSLSERCAAPPEPRFPDAAAAIVATAPRSRFSFTFLRLDSRLGLCGVWPGEDDEEEEESLRLGALEDVRAGPPGPPPPTPTEPEPEPPTLSGRVTSATARQTSMSAWKYVEKRLCSEARATAAAAAAAAAA